MAWDQLLERGLTVRDSPLETGRFGCSTTRVTIGPGLVDRDALLAVIEGLPADVLIVRYDASRLELPSTFARSRRAVIPAGTLTYWEKPISVARPQTLSTIEVLTADTVDTDTISALVTEIVRASFKDYGNHYTANPLLDRAAALAGYEDWALRSLGENPENVLVMTDDGEPIGMATLESSADAGHLEILLAGLVPAAQGRRLYGSLLDACEGLAADRGARRLIISTQVHNVRVQRAWARQGLRPFAAVETIHLIDRDLLLAHSEGTTHLGNRGVTC